jgi:hypothetical protein
LEEVVAHIFLEDFPFGGGFSESFLILFLLIIRIVLGDMFIVYCLDPVLVPMGETNIFW